jgi:Flp pilus assembly protein TadG
MIWMRTQNHQSPAHGRRAAGAPHSAATVRRARGISIVWMTVMFTVLCAVVSLAVDYGRVQLVKTELQRVADAAARYAVVGLKSAGGVAAAQANAQNAANDNLADGTPVQLDASTDIEFGQWIKGSMSFTPLSGAARASANSIRVTARRTHARGNAVPLLFARLVGASSCDVAASAIAFRNSGYTLVGINSVSLSGVGLIDSYDSSAGPYNAATAGNKAVVVSNGNITLTGSPLIKGDANPGPGGQVVGTPKVTGSTSALSAPLVFPMPTVDPAYNNAAINKYLSGSGDFSMGKSRTYTLTSGIYSVRNVTMNSTAVLNITGDVTLYVSGNMSLSGGVNVSGNQPGNFKIRMVTPNTSVSMTGNTALYADLYAPGSTVTIGGNGDFYGTVVGKTLSLSGRAGVHYDETIFPYGGYAAGGVFLVK